MMPTLLHCLETQCHHLCYSSFVLRHRASDKDLPLASQVEGPQGGDVTYNICLLCCRSQQCLKPQRQLPGSGSPGCIQNSIEAHDVLLQLLGSKQLNQ